MKTRSRTVKFALKTFLILFTFLFSSGAFGVPYELYYSGRLTTLAGAPIEGPINVEIKFFRSESGADEVAVTVPAFTNVSLDEGTFALSIQLTPAQFHTVFPDSSSSPTYIQLKDATHDQVYPRQVYTVVPYALKVPIDNSTLGYNSDGKLTISNLGGDVTGTVGSTIVTKIQGNSVSNSSPSTGDILKWNGSSWAPGTAGGVGTVTSVASGTGLTGGTITGSGTISVAAGGIGTTQLADTAVTTAKITDANVTSAKIASGIDAVKIGGGTIDNTEFSYLNGVTSAIQTQIDGKAASSHTQAATTIGGGTIDNTEFGYLDGVTSAIQTQLSGKQASITPTSDITAGSLTSAKQNAINVSPFNTAAGNTGELRFNELAANGTNYIGFKAPDVLAADKIWTLPSADGTSGQVLKTNGSGVLSWVDQTSTAPVTSVNTLTGAVTLTTTNISEGTNLYYTDARAKAAAVGDVITDAVTDKAPSQNAVFDALALKSATSHNHSGVYEPAGLSADVVTNAKMADNSVGSAEIIDLSIGTGDIATGAVTAAKIAACSDTQILKMSGVNWVCSSDANAGGTVTSVASGTGLTGGTITGSGTISVAAGGIGTTQLADTAVTTAKITDANVTSAKIASGIDAVKIGGGTIDNTEFSYLNGVTSAIQTQIDGKAASSHTQAATTIGGGTIDNTEFGYLDGVTSAIQTQLNGKQASGNYVTALTGDVTASGPGSVAATIASSAVTSAKIADGTIATADLADGAVTSVKITAGIDAAKIGGGAIDNTEFSYLNGVTSAIQTQLNGKLSTSHNHDNTNPSFGTVYTSNFFRSTGNTGWYSQDYGGGWYMTDATWVRTYGSKNVWSDGSLGSNGGLTVGYSGAASPSGGAIVSGSVGIGTASPVYTLDVGGAGSSGSLSRLGGMSILTAESGYEWWTGSFTSTGPWQLTHRKISDSSWTNALTVTTSGGIGIGTTNPSSPLTVSGVVESKSGGFKFPDGTTQTTASSGGGIPSCPSGFTMVGTAGKRGNFCIDTSQRSAATFYNAMSTCHNLSLTEGDAFLCDLKEWYKACQVGGSPSLAGMTGDWEWVAAFDDYYGPTVVGSSGCSSSASGGDPLSVSWGFRCCIR